MRARPAAARARIRVVESGERDCRVQPCCHVPVRRLGPPGLGDEQFVCLPGVAVPEQVVAAFELDLGAGAGRRCQRKRGGEKIVGLLDPPGQPPGLRRTQHATGPAVRLDSSSAARSSACASAATPPAARASADVSSSASATVSSGPSVASARCQARLAPDERPRAGRGPPAVSPAPPRRRPRPASADAGNRVVPGGRQGRRPPRIRRPPGRPGSSHVKRIRARPKLPGEAAPPGRRRRARRRVPRMRAARAGRLPAPPAADLVRSAGHR